MKNRPVTSRLLTLCVVAASLAAASATAVAGSQTATGAKLYYTWLQGSVATIEKQIPQMTASAEVAAKLACDKGQFPLFGGDGMFMGEVFGRSGGMMPLDWPDLSKTDLKAFVVYALHETEAAAKVDLTKIAQLVKQGCTVVVMGNTSYAKPAATAGAKYFIDTGAAPTGGLIKGPKGYLMPTEPTANLAALWTWTAEFVSACTRLGKMPTMWQSVAIPGGADRDKKLEGTKFHKEKPQAVKAGVLGKAYIAALKADLAAVFKELPAIQASAKQASAAVKAGGAAYTFVFGHAIMHAFESPYDAKLLTNITNGWNGADTSRLKKGDSVLVINYISIPRGKAAGEFAEKARAAGAKITWSFAGYDPAERKEIQKGELFIDQHWQKGDAAVTLKGYDINILPTSGVIANAVLWMVESEMAAQ